MFSRRKILVVEDNELNRKMLCDILSPVYDVLEAENGQKALDILKEYGEGLSLILLDIVMPVMDGYTFLSVMKADSAYSSIPVIVTTQNDGEADEIAALSYGASDFVAKPYRPLIILHRVASIINLRETASMMNMMQYDRLSGLYSKEFFYQKVKTILISNPGIQYDIVCSDIENFKLINDVFGVSTGDKLLCTVAEVYKESREYNGICGRLNADRFACLAERRRNYTNGMFQEKIEKISKKMELGSIVMKWGIYTIENYTVPVDQMCDRALLAAQSIKGQYGKYFAEYDDKLRDLLLKEQAITDSMESALRQNQFKVYLQPKYRIKDGLMVGAEALVRWNHPKWGIQSPAKFIPLFEKNGFITKLDQFVWEKACVFMREWDDKGYTPISVSVNVSRADIYNADITDILTGIIQKYDLPPSRLHLEITESAYTENPKQIIDTVAHLRELGFIIEMDDFGTGYSSLNMLNEMPIDLLKLDMKFIQNETAKSDSKGILQFIINLARWMNLGVVAEGVETKEQLNFLSENGCDYVQGYYFSKPLPQDEFETLLADLSRAQAVSGLDHIMSHLGFLHNELERKDVPPGIEELVHDIPGGIASYRVENNRFIPTFFSDGVIALSGHTREEYEDMARFDAMELIYEPDRGMVAAAARTALVSGEVLDVSYRIRSKEGNLIWIHLNGRRIGPLAEASRFYAVFTRLSAETRQFQSILNETADSIYIIEKESYDLLYINMLEDGCMGMPEYTGQKCYTVLHDKSAPCEFCTLKTHKPDGKEHEMSVEETGQYYSIRFREINWNGTSAYVRYVRNITEEVRTQKEKECLEQYFQTVVKKLPGGIAVMHFDEEGKIVPEFLSEGFSELIGMNQKETWKLYGQNVMSGIHPKDRERVKKQMLESMYNEMNRCKMIYRLKKRDDGYVWVENIFSPIKSEGGENKFYATYRDVTKELSEQEQFRKKYNEMLMQHYRTPEPNALIIGHYSITQNKIREIIDHTGSDILNTFGTVRENFLTGLSSFIVEKEQRQKFLDIYLNTPALTAFKRKDTEQILKCFVKFPAEESGRYVQFKVNLVETPDAEDITGILTVIDITEQVITDKILHQLSVTNYDFVIDLNLDTDFYTVLAHNTNGNCMPGPQGSHLKRIEEMVNSVIVPRDREVYGKLLDPAEIRLRLKKEKSYTFAYSITDENGDIRTKNMTVSAADLRIGRVCMVRTDITDSIREQRGLLNMIAYTFELAGFINVKRELLTLYTRRTILDNLSPQVMNYCENVVEGFSDIYTDTNKGEEAYQQFFLENMLRKLEDKPEGYDFLLSQQMGNGLRYKQINVLWGDSDHSTICFVQADVTDILSAERDTKAALEEALSLAEEANRTKSEFLSAMSHDIRTPMNAIMGMTVLASAHIEDQERVADCLKKISISSKHLLSLINDVLDMGKIERSQITLSRTKIILSTLLDQVLAIITSQAQSAGIEFIIRKKHIQNDWFYGDALRINQILINVLSNAIKFTPEGGIVEFHVEEIPALKYGNVRYCFMVKDTGVGIPEKFLTYLFEPFTRSYSAYRVEGTGLGLSITKGLVDLMGGIISVESVVSQGTEFRIELECESAAESAGNTMENKRLSFSDLEARKLFADRCFLVAEDNEINAEILCELLSLYGAESIVVTDGAQAVSAFENAPKKAYDAILMDIQMPEMNGYQAARVIRKMNREDAESIPIVAMTANAFAEDIREALDAGMNAHVAKPIDIEMLQVTLSKLL